MATSIHHGAPGSYKSFALVQRFAIPALKAGRVVVSNVRGFDSLERVIAQYPEIDFPQSARLIYLETTTRESRTIMAGWFHWVPIGAMVIIDEGQEIYPDRRDFKLESLDAFVCPEGFEPEVIAEGRPVDVFTAYDKQRHYNWDIFISTTNVAKIKSEIRQVTEWAYRHRALGGLVPWMKNQWYEHQHDPENSGKSESHRVGSPVRYKADLRIFKCYKSTATGEATESQAGQSIFKSSAILFPFFVIFAAVLFSIYLFFFKKQPESDLSKVPSVFPISSAPIEVAKNDGFKSNVQSVGALSSFKAPAGSFGGYDLISIAYNDVRDLSKIKFNYILNNVIKTIGFDYFINAGYKIISRGICAVDLVANDGNKISLYCETPVIASCNVSVKSTFLVSYRDCSTVNQSVDNSKQSVGVGVASISEKMVF